MSNHSFDIRIAEEYKSVDLAILVWHFQYWIMKNKRLGRNFHDGRTWTYQTYEEIAAVFPYWSRDQVKRILKKAIESEIIIKGNFSKNSFDQTIWYAFKDEEKFGISQFREMEETSERDSGIGRNRPIHFPLSPDGKDEIARCYKDTDTLPYTLTNKRESEQKFGRVASFFFEKISSINPKIKKPNLDKWALELKRLFKDGNSEDDIIKAIEYVISSQPSTNGFCWSTVVMCPTSLRKHFPKIWAEIGNQKRPANILAENEKLAKAIEAHFRHRKEKDIVLGHNYLEFINGQYVSHLNFDDKDFKFKCNSELSKRNLRLDL
jgi:hypothetical protein